jgi:hypothetical protein
MGNFTWTGGILLTVRKLIFPAALAVALLAGGLVVYLAMRHPDPVLTTGQAQASLATLPQCSDMFQPGRSIHAPAVGPQCADPDGKWVVVGSFRCADGRHLWQVDASTGAPAGYGFDGRPYQRGTSSDPGYSVAYATCHGRSAGSQTP